MFGKVITGAGLLAMAVQAAANTPLETLLVVGSADDRSSRLTGEERLTVVPGQAGPLKDSAELLAQLPGVQADSRSNYAQDTRITLRGFGARSAFGVRGIQLTVDGVPVSTPDGQGQLSSVMLDSITTASVLRGPMAALFGNASGGVIALESAKPTSNQAGLGLTTGSDGFSRQTVNGQWADERMAATVMASSMDVDGYRPHSEAERRHINTAFHYQTAEGVETIVRVSANRDPLLQDPLGLTPEQWADDPKQHNTLAERFNTRKRVNHDQQSITVRQRQGDARWQTSVWHSERDMTQYLGFTGEDLTSAGGVVALNREVAGINGRYTVDSDWGQAKLSSTLGAEWSQMRDKRAGYVNLFGVSGDLRRDEKGKVDNADIYTLLQWSWEERFLISGGVRYSDIRFEVDDYFINDHNPDDSGSMKYREWSSALSFAWQFTDQYQAFVSTGQGFETPTLTETAYRLEGTGLNDSLRASDVRQHEAGLRFNDGNFYASASAFLIDTRDEIVVDRSIDGRTIYRNAAETERSGFEVFGQWQPSAFWTVSATLNYLDAHYGAGQWDGKRLPGVARHNHALQAQWQPTGENGFSAGLALRYRDSVAADDANTIFAPSATTADVMLGWQQVVGNWHLRSWLQVANVFDETYVGSVIVNQSNRRSFESAAGRQTYAGIAANYRW